MGAADWLVLVERRVQQDRNPGPFEGVDEPVVPRVLIPPDGLEPARSVDVRGSGDLVDPVGSDRIGHQHEGRQMVLREVVTGRLLQHGGPANDLPVGERVGGLGEDLGLGEFRVHHPSVLERLLQAGVTELLSPAAWSITNPRGRPRT
jgi:hypothetical protein